MQIFRGPSSVPFPDQLHELVSTSDPATMASVIDGNIVLCANITKEPTERQSLAHIKLDSSDVLSLHAKLISDLQARSMELNETKKRVNSAKATLYEMYEVLNVVADEGSRLPSGWQTALDLVGVALHDLGEK
jgi:hypothetical protein